MESREKPRISLAAQVMVGLVLGIAAGLFFGELAAPLRVVGDAFVKLLQVSVIPYILVALITGLGRLKYREVKDLAISAGGVLLLLWGIGISLVLVLPFSFPEWPSRSFFQKSSIEAHKGLDLLQLYIPSNPFFSLSNALVPAIVVFSIMIGLAVIGVKKKQNFLKPLAAVGETLIRVTGFVAKLAPLGVFALIASATGTMSFSDLARLQVYVVLFALLALVVALWILPALVASLTPLRYGDILKSLRTPLLTAFATGSALVVLPILSEICKDLVASARRHTAVLEDEDEEEEEAQSSVDVLIPTFYSFPTVGLLMTLGFVLFAGWYVGSAVSVAQYPTIILAGVPSLFGGAIVAIPFVLGVAELPRDLLQQFLSVNVIGGRFMVFVSTMHYATIALIGAFALQGMHRIQIWPLFRVITIGTLLVAAVLIGVHAFYSHVAVVPYTKDQALKGLNLVRGSQPSVVHRQAPKAALGAGSRGTRSFSEIKASGVLRACYLPGNYPVSYFNTKGDLVGFDIEMAHRFAEQLSLRLEFLPLERLTTAAERLASGYCDVLFNALIMDLRRTDTVLHTDPFNTATAAFLVADHKRDDFTTWEKIRERGEITIKTSAFQALVRDISTHLPEAELVRLSSREEQAQFFDSRGEGADAFLDTAEAGSAWTILHPLFTVVIPRPVVQYPVVYVVARNNPSLLRAMNEWLLIEKGAGTIDQLYDYWIQGKTAKTAPPRWSVIRNVLKWVD